MLLTEAIGIFLKCCEFERGLNSNTIRAYRSDLYQFGAFVLETKELGAITNIDKDTFRRYLHQLSTTYKPKSIKRKMASLRALFNFLEYEDYITCNPMRKLRVRVKEGRVLPRTIASRHIRELFSHVYRLQAALTPKSSSYSKYTRDIAVLELLFATGMRVSEVSKLKLSDVDLVQDCLQVVGKGSRERVIPLCCDQVRRALAAFSAIRDAKNPNNIWFFTNARGNRLSEQSIRFMVRKYAHDAGIKAHITPHMFRHTVATQLLQNGMGIRSIQRLLGHSSILTTQIYTHIDDQTQRRDIRRHHPRNHMKVGDYMHDN